MFSVVGEPLMNCRLVPAAGERPFQDKLMVLARLQPVLRQKRFERRLESGDVEDRLHRATVAAAADERAVRPLAQGEVQGADEDGLPRAGLACDDVVARLQLERQVGHEGEVLDAQGRQHVAVPPVNLAGKPPMGKLAVGRAH